MLYFRMFLLHHVAHEASPEGVLFGMEHPMDPCEYMKDGKEYASLWAWPEIGFLEAEKGMMRASFSQGSVGHSVKKPTTFLVNDWFLFTELHMKHEGHINRVERPGTCACACLNLVNGLSGLRASHELGSELPLLSDRESC